MNEQIEVNKVNEEKDDRILIVDDIKTNIQLLGSILKDSGYQINVAMDGLKAIETVKIMPPDLILLDVMMPGLDGFETCKCLKANPETKNIPVIFLTAKVGPEDIIKGFKAGAIDYLTKPFNTDELLVRVRTQLDLRRAQKLIELQNKDLKEAAKLREDVDQIMRHDLKAPLNAILGYPQVILMREKLSEKGEKYLHTIEQAGYRMLNMINLSLDLFKMERGAYQFQPTPVELITILKKIEMELKDLRRVNELTFEIEIAGMPLKQEDTFYIMGENLLCYSMLANLIKNAVEASPKRESILVKIERKESVTICIQNKGMVPEEIRETFFEKFSTFGKSAGTGLGTYSAKLIAETLHGKISMITSAEAGTTITIQLPEKSDDSTQATVKNSK